MLTSIYTILCSPSVANPNSHLAFKVLFHLHLSLSGKHNFPYPSAPLSSPLLAGHRFMNAPILPSLEPFLIIDQNDGGPNQISLPPSDPYQSFFYYHPLITCYSLMHCYLILLPQLAVRFSEGRCATYMCVFIFPH